MIPPSRTAPADHLVAIDWGTSSLRAWLLDGRGEILDRSSSSRGILFTEGRPFPDLYAEIFGSWFDRVPDAAALACGMIGSRQGWVEAPYAGCPAGFGDLARAIVWCATPHGALGIVPGISSERENVPDVMRGEETQVFGALAASGRRDGLVVLPGTHSKWVEVRNGRIDAFRTFMTGEVYGLLRQHSILGRLMSPEPAEPAALDGDAFDAGCAAARDAGGAILHAAFRVRTLGLFGRLEPDAAPDFLSGLLVGEEVREALSLVGARPSRVDLVCRGDLAERYRRCLAAEGIEAVAADPDVTARGLFALARAAGLVGGP